MAASETPSLEHWDIRHADEVEWIPWGSEGTARAKILGEAEGYMIALVEAGADYRTSPHEHGYPEFFYLVAGSIKNQGHVMKAGDAYAAATGSVHTEFAVEEPSTYLSIFRL